MDVSVKGTTADASVACEEGDACSMGDIGEVFVVEGLREGGGFSGGRHGVVSGSCGRVCVGYARRENFGLSCDER